MRIDMHVHTKASDGLYRPSDVVRMAAAAGLDVIAISDHDTVQGIDEARGAAAETRLRVVPAVEINSYHGDTEYHILGYWVDHTSVTLRSSLGELQKARIDRMHKVIARLGEIGITLTPEEVMVFAEEGSVGRPHIARALVKKKYASSVRDAFNKYIAEGKPAYVPRSKLSPREAIAIITSASGLAVLAHPGLWGGDELIPQLAAWGIIGIEAYSPDHTPSQIRHYLGMAKEHGLIVTGGSDFHGWGDNAAMRIGSVCTPPDQFALLQAKAKRSS
ncbi:MAG: PHP domain-containing protein [Candidatus Aureabacteria bacterium]|nr:PHP domain-containing protein [Candidatus Auribacterota bacterium]